MSTTNKYAHLLEAEAGVMLFGIFTFTPGVTKHDDGARPELTVRTRDAFEAVCSALAEVCDTRLMLDDDETRYLTRGGFRFTFTDGSAILANPETRAFMLAAGPECACWLDHDEDCECADSLCRDCGENLIHSCPTPGCPECGAREQCAGDMECEA